MIESDLRKFPLFFENYKSGFPNSTHATGDIRPEADRKTQDRRDETLKELVVPSGKTAGSNEYDPILKVGTTELK